MTVPDLGDPAPGAANMTITRTYPINKALRFYTTADGGVTKDYVDLTGYTGSAQVRAHNDSALLLECTVTVAEPQTGDDLGRLTVSAAADDTTPLPVVVAKWDLRLVDADGAPRRWLKGSAPIVDPVTEVEGS